MGCSELCPSLAACSPPLWVLQGDTGETGMGWGGDYRQTEWKMKPFRWQMSLREMRWAEAVMRMATLGKGELILKQVRLGKLRVGR